MQVYSTKEVLKKLKVSRNTLLNWFKKGKVKDVAERDRNGYRIFTEKDVDRLLKYKNKTVGNSSWKVVARKNGVIKSNIVVIVFLLALTVCGDSYSRAEEIPTGTMNTREFEIAEHKDPPSEEIPTDQIFQVLPEDYYEEDLFSKYAREDYHPIADAASNVAEGNVPFPVSFSGLGLDNEGDVAVYRWNFSGGKGFDYSSRDSGDSVYTYRQAGVFTSTFSVTNDKGYTDTYSLLINAQEGKDAPVAVASANTYNGTAPLNVNFFGSAFSSTGTIIRYEWDFDDNGIYDSQNAVDANASYVFMSEGVHPVTLRVTDNMALMSTKTIYINVIGPGADYNVSAHANPTSGICPLAVSFGAVANNTGKIIKYEWDFDGDGRTDWESAASALAEYTYREPGTYSARVKVIWEDMLSAVDVIEIRAEEDPEKIFPISDFDVSVFEGEGPLEVYFIALAVPGSGETARHEWDFDGDGRWDKVVEDPDAGTGEESDISYTYNEIGMYRVTLRVTNSFGLSDRTSRFITIVNSQLQTAEKELPPEGIETVLEETIETLMPEEEEIDVFEETVEPGYQTDVQLEEPRDPLASFVYKVKEPETYTEETFLQTAPDVTIADEGVFLDETENASEGIAPEDTNSSEEENTLKDKAIKAVISWLESFL